VFQNRALGRIFGPKREYDRRLDKTNEEFRNLHASPNIVSLMKYRRIKWGGGHVACLIEMRNAYNILVGKPEGKSSLVKPKRRWEDNIRMDLREMGWDFVDWIYLAQGRDH
jgi:hypothetical protein